MRILITGGSGYIGSVLWPYLLQNGHHVTIVDLIAPHGLFFQKDREVGVGNFVAGDVRDMRLIQPLLRNVDAVMPLAGVVGAPACKEDGYGAKTINSFAIAELLSRMSSAQTIVFPATDSGYPNGDVDETSPMSPQSVYARTKHGAEMAVLEHGGVTLRLASVFGMSPRMRSDLIVNNFVLHAVNRKPIDVYEGHFIRNFVHIRDVAAAFNHALSIPPGAYNVGDHWACMSKSELCHLIKGHCPWFEWREVDGKHDPDRRDCRVSNQKLHRTGWDAKYSLSYGIAELMEGYASSAV